MLICIHKAYLTEQAPWGYSINRIYCMLSDYTLMWVYATLHRHIKRRAEVKARLGLCLTWNTKKRAAVKTLNQFLHLELKQSSAHVHGAPRLAPPFPPLSNDFSMQQTDYAACGQQIQHTYEPHSTTTTRPARFIILALTLPHLRLQLVLHKIQLWALMISAHRSKKPLSEPRVFSVQ